MKLWQLAIGAAVLSTACSSAGSVSSFRGAPFPVMLGPKRLGPPVQATKVDDWYGEAVSVVAQYDSGSYRVTTTHQAATGFMAERSTRYVEKNVQGGITPDLELQVTDLKGTAYITAFGGAKKEIMYCETDIMRLQAPASTPAPAAAPAGGAK
jgi:hypothetical protein